MEKEPSPHPLNLSFLSFRYLRPKRSFVSLITLISVLGVVLGVWIMASTLAIMSGYISNIRKTILGIEPHLVITNDGVMDTWREILPKVEDLPGVVDSAIFSHGEVVLDTVDRPRPRVVAVRGLDPKPGPILESLEKLIVEGEGSFDLSDDYIIMGQVLAEEMNLKVGDKVVLHSLANGQEMLRAAQEGREVEEFIFASELEIKGIYSSGRHDYDEALVFIPLEHGQTLYALGDSVHGIALQLANPYEDKKAKDLIAPLIPEKTRVYSWVDANEGLFRMLSMQRVILRGVLLIIVVAAGGCIMGTMITITSQKRREIGLLKALGAPVSQILGVFVLQGAVVGLLGCVLGFIATVVFLAFRQQIVALIASLTGINVFSADIYYLYDVPATVNAFDFTLIAVVTLVGCALSAFLPAWFAAKLDAAEALRSESTV